MDELEQLASLLGTADKQRLARLETRVNDPRQRTQDIAEVLPTALRALLDQADLISALQTPVVTCVKEYPQSFVKAILPVMGPLLRRTTEDAIKPIKAFLQTLKTQINDLDTSLDNLEQAHVLGQKQLSRLEKHIEDIKQENSTQFNQLNYYVQTQQTELNDIEKSLNNLENAQVSQHLQLSQLIKLLNTFKQTQATQQTQLSQLDKSLSTLEKAQVTQQTQLSQLDEHLNSFENTQAKQIEQVTLRFNELEQHFNNPQQRAQEVANVLPNAIRLADQPAISSAQYGEVKLTQSLQTPVEHCIKLSINQDVGPFADALFPVMGPAIRKSINETFKTILQRINRTLEQSFSIKGLIWRIQAIIKGIAYSDFILQKTLVYRVEQVFLIHRETGLLIQHAHIEGIEVGDSDAVSAMFTAIQDFIRDSFSANKQEELDSVELGEYTVWIEHGPHAILACVIRGVAQITFKNDIMRPLLENLHGRYGVLLEQFSGDSEPLQPCQHLLQQTLQVEEKESEKLRLLSPQLVIILSFIFPALFILVYFHFEHQQRLEDYLNALHDTPGIMVISTEEQNGKLLVHGMRDPLAEEPQTIAHRFQLNDDDVLFKGRSYQDLDTSFVEQRLRQWLKPPDTVQMSLQNTVLHLSGQAEQAWIDKVSNSVGMMAGFTKVVTDELINTDAPFQAFLKTLNNTPGLIVISSGRENEQQFVTGMRDPLAESPEEIAQRMQVSDVAMRWTHYQDLTPPFVEKRVRQRLAPPSTVQLRLEGDVLHLTGYASQAWIDKAINNANTVVGINQLEINELLNTDGFLLAEAKRKLMPPERVTLTVRDGVLQVTGRVDSATFQTLQQHIQQFQSSQKELAGIETSQLLDGESEIRKLTQSIENTLIYFSEDASKFTLKQEATLQALLKNVQQVLAFSQELHLEVGIQVIGNTDGIGTEIYNRQLSQRRAQVVINWLQAHGIAKHDLTITPPAKIRFGENQPIAHDRNVSFRVIIPTLK